MAEPELGIALLGSGRMADVYGPKIIAHSGLRLSCVFNPNLSSASAARVAQLYDTHQCSNLDQALSDSDVDAVIIATPTDTHLDYIRAAASAGKPIYCEKPLDKDPARARDCLKLLAAHPVPFMLGFNRRFDPDINALQQAVQAGEIGQITMVHSTSREPAPPPVEYVKSSGGYFIDATIHDIDLMCWITGERPVEVFAAGSTMFDPEIGVVGDVDLTMTTLKMPSGALVHINNSRQCAYGFDQRLEVFGTEGMIQTRNHHDDPLVRWGPEGTNVQSPLKHFFLERYDQSFSNALDEFYSAVTTGRTPSCTAQDGSIALAIAVACDKARCTGRAVVPDYT